MMSCWWRLWLRRCELGMPPTGSRGRVCWSAWLGCRGSPPFLSGWGDGSYGRETSSRLRGVVKTVMEV